VTADYTCRQRQVMWCDFSIFGAFSRLFLANFVLMIPDGDIFRRCSACSIYATCSLADIFLHRGKLQRIPRGNSLDGGAVPSPSPVGGPMYTRLHRTYDLLCRLTYPKHLMETRDVAHDLLVGLFVLFLNYLFPSWFDRYHHLLILPLILCNPPLEQPNEDLSDKNLFGSIQDHWNLNKRPRLVI
jgi:hypothetical protein